MTGPDLPPPTEPMTANVMLSRWPTAAEKTELIDGVLVYSGHFDERDLATAQRTYPGRRILINAQGGLEIHPADPQQPLQNAK